jgi:hypothetical protein
MFMKDEVIVVLKVLVEDQSYLVSFQVVTLFDPLSFAETTEYRHLRSSGSMRGCDRSIQPLRCGFLAKTTQATRLCAS